MSTLNQQTLTDSGANERPPMLEKGNYIPWESTFRRFLDNKLKDKERMWNLIQNGPFKRPMIPNPENDHEEVLEPLSKMSARNKSQYIADVKVMNYFLQAIPNDIYNSVNACKNAKEMWEQIKRLMFGSELEALKCEENDFMLDNSYGEETMEELTTTVMLMDWIQPADVMRCNNIIQISDDDQIDSNIIFDDLYVENNGGTSEHDLNAHDEFMRKLSSLDRIVYNFIVPSPMTAPKKSTVETAIFIFVGDKTRPLSFSFFEKTSISLIYTAMNDSVPLKHLSIFLWNTAATILQISSAIRHISNIDNMYIKSYSFSLFSSLPGVLTPVRGESLKILNGFDVSLPVSHLLWSSQSFGHQKAINGFDMPLPVAVCSGLVNPLAPRKGKFHGGLMTLSTLYT
ncbi:hypothetical protein Tco_0978285 [Tanacetum coccineum]|uniref:Uncharacterized protein n=1 Tax=Tanacetum coccineum TaxID=301880 RepID=A0ABQ5EMH8_9ASTR